MLRMQKVERHFFFRGTFRTQRASGTINDARILDRVQDADIGRKNA